MTMRRTKTTDRDEIEPFDAGSAALRWAAMSDAPKDGSEFVVLVETHNAHALTKSGFWQEVRAVKWCADQSTLTPTIPTGMFVKGWQPDSATFYCGGCGRHRLMRWAAPQPRHARPRCVFCGNEASKRDGRLVSFVRAASGKWIKVTVESQRLKRGARNQRAWARGRLPQFAKA